jgi:hypothetical protein
VEGYIELEWEDQKFELLNGETILLPAIINQLKIHSKFATVIEVFL